MAKNNLTPEQDLLTRRFYVEVAERSGLIPDSAVAMRTLRAILLELLNYDQLPNGNFVEKGKARTVKFGQSLDLPNEWPADTRRAEDAVKRFSSDYTSTGKSSKGN